MDLLIEVGLNATNTALADHLAAVLERSARVGVIAQVLTGIDFETSRDSLKIAKQFECYNLYTTAGLHPTYVKPDTWKSEMERISALLGKKNPLIKAVGETGLDYFKNCETKEAQRDAFREHIRMAVEFGLPMFLHERNAFEDFYAILREMKKEFGDKFPKIVIHCFTSSQEALKAYVDFGAYISISGFIAKNKVGKALRDCVSQIPLDKLMIETDAPFMMPDSRGASAWRKFVQKSPLKSSPNEPHNLPAVAEAVANCYGVARSVIAEKTTENAKKFFSI